MGGDGTVNEVVNGLVAADAHAELAVIPRGTGVDFVRSFEIPTKLDDAFSVVLAGTVATDRPRPGDVPLVERRDGDAVLRERRERRDERRDREARERVEEPLREGLVLLRDVLGVRALARRARCACRSTTRSATGAMRDVVVANCRYFGGGMMICPEAEPDDGVLDALLIGDITKTDLALTLPKIYRGTHLPHPKAELLRGTTVSVDARVPLPIQLDGEQPGTTPVTFDVVPQALRLRVP